MNRPGNCKTENLKPSPLGRLIAERGLTQSQVAEETGLNRFTIHKWTWGVIGDASTLITLAKYFNVSTDYLLGLRDKP